MEMAPFFCLPCTFLYCRIGKADVGDFLINPEIFTAETQRAQRKQNAIKNI
jgi:hypothetical protein